MKLSWSILFFILGGILILSLSSCFNSQRYQPYYSWSDLEIDSTIQRSAAIEEIISPYRMRLDSIMDEVIGHATHDLTAAAEYESTLGTFVTKLLLKQSTAAYNTEVDVALMNHRGGLRAPINQGGITLGDIFEVMPFENEMVLIDLTGEQLLSVIDLVANGGRGFHILSNLPRHDTKGVYLRDMIITEVRELTAAGKQVEQDIMNTVTIPTP
jgi:2',3'-cyclic-nucleotide 2'-phosphodiesterase (5'-nucleotidase family)